MRSAPRSSASAEDLRAPLARRLNPADRLIQRPQAEAPRVANLEATNLRYASTISGVPPNFARSSGRWLAMPTGRVEVARAHHQAALREEDAVPNDFVGAEQGGDHDVPPGLEASVDTDANAAAKPVRDERLLRLGETELPRSARVLDQGHRPGAAVAQATWTTSTWALATPAAITPTPLEETSLTEMSAFRG